MADMHMTAPSGGEATSGNLASAANWLGAAMSLALIVGVSVWGYRLVMRDVSGVPVVRAIEGPMRVAPEDPGGQIARHEGLAVNDVAGTGASTPPPDRLVLAPQPLDLTPEDLPVTQLDLSETLTEQEEIALASLRQDAEAEADETPQIALSDIVNADDPIKALADQIAANAKPFTEIEPAPNTGVFDQTPSQEVAALVTPPDLIPASVPGVARSLRPTPRPAGLQQASLAIPAAAPSSAVAELSPDDIPSGTRLVQFGAYDSPEIAREQWGRLQARFSDFLVGKDRVIEQATSGGRVFYRLRAHGFADLSDSRRFCSALVAEGADCIPVVSR